MKLISEKKYLSIKGMKKVLDLLIDKVYTIRLGLDIRVIN